MARFDEGRLDDEHALARVDPTLRSLAESGARLRRAVLEAAEAAVVARTAVEDLDRPRAVLVLGPDADLVRDVLAPGAGTPVVVWRAAELPGWVGGPDLVVVLAPQGAPDATASALAAAAVRRGSQVLAVCGSGGPVADHAAGRWSTVLTTAATEPTVVALVALEHLASLGLAPAADLEAVAGALDDVAVACSPYRDTTTNPAKQAAVGLAESLPVVGARRASPLSSHAVDRAALLLRRASGLPVLGGRGDDLAPVLEAARARTVFDDPYDDPAGAAPPSLLLVGAGPDGPEAPDDPSAAELRALADARGARTVTVDGPAGPPLVAHAAALLQVAYVAVYLALGAVDD